MGSPLKNKNKKAAELGFDDIRTGKAYSFKRRISRKDVIDFARLSGDCNPLHLEDKFAGETIFGGTIIHGMLASSLFSTLAGMYCPGKYAVILSQEIKYIHPIRPGDTVTVMGKVITKVYSVKVVVIDAAIFAKGKEKAIECRMNVKVVR